MEIKSVLKKFGLSEKEVEVYLAALSLGPSVVSDIAEKSGINRSTAYVVLNFLRKKGLVSFNERRGVKIYSSLAPQKLIKQFENLADKYKDLAKAAKEVLPKIKLPAPPTASTLPKIQIFEGAEGLKTVYEDTLGSLETIRSYASSQTTPEEAASYQSILAKKNIKIKFLVPDDKLAADLKSRETKGKTLYGLSPEISVYDNKVVFISATNKTAFIIESQEFAAALKKAFDMSWQGTTQPDKKLSLESA